MKSITGIVLLAALLFTMTSCGGGGEEDKSEFKKQLLTKVVPIFGVIPDKMPGSEHDTPLRIELGEKLYFDGRLSENDEISCNSCHEIDGVIAGVDNLPTSPGTIGELGRRNSPTVFNAGFHFVQFWDGREPDLKAQAKGPILDPLEMAMPDEATVVAKLKGIAEYPPLFAAAFPGEEDPLTYDNIAEAIAAFERTLITHDRFDDFQNGDINALTNMEAEGLDLFVKKGCITCHTSPLLGGNIYQKMGLIKPYEGSTDEGRFEVTGVETDKHMFKVPSMRNIALTGPYFHDGEEEDLTKAVRRMADMQLGQTLTNMEAMKIVKFFDALTDKELAKANAAESE